jgi:hypothetical protein
MNLMKWLGSRGKPEVIHIAPVAVPAPRVAAPGEYRLLHAYLAERYANVVVLRFAEIEDLLGFALPELARVRPEWWNAPDPHSPPSAQSRSWIEANRTAQPNLLAGTVMFERVPA